MGLETQTLGLFVVQHLDIVLFFHSAEVGDSAPLFVHCLPIGTFICHPDQLCIGTGKHHLVVSRAYFECLPCFEVSKLMTAAYSVLINMLVHLATRHNVEELTTTADTHTVQAILLCLFIGK